RTVVLSTQRVPMTRGASLRSRVKGNFQARFWSSGGWGDSPTDCRKLSDRSKEKNCKRTFNDLTGTLLDGSKRSVMHWIFATLLLCLSCSSRRIARELGVPTRTSYRWCWWLRNAALSYEMERQLAGTVEADDL